MRFFCSGNSTPNNAHNGVAAGHVHIAFFLKPIENCPVFPDKLIFIMPIKKRTQKPNHLKEPTLYDHFGNPLDQVDLLHLNSPSSSPSSQPSSPPLSSHLHHHHDIHQVLKRDKELEEKKRSEVAEVATLVREAGEGLLAKKWLVLHCNVFLKINSPNTTVLPAEVSFLFQLLHSTSLPA